MTCVACLCGPFSSFDGAAVNPLVPRHIVVDGFHGFAGGLVDGFHGFFRDLDEAIHGFAGDLVEGLAHGPGRREADREGPAPVDGHLPKVRLE